MLKALASDIDGTLFFSKMKPPIKISDIQAIKKYQNAGNLFGLCSGRPKCGVINLFDEQVKPDFYVISSGALILDRNKEVLFEQPIAFSYIYDLYNTYHQEAIVIIQSDNNDFVYKNKPEGFEDKYLMIEDINDLKDHKIYGISLVFENNEITREHNNKISQKYPALQGYQNENSIDIVTKGCSKGNALKKIKEIYQISSMAGIGDSYNDLPMLESVDVAFSFHNAPIELKKIVAYLVASVSEAIDILAKKG